MNSVAVKITARPVRFGDLAVCVNDRVDDPSKAGVDRYVGLEHLDSDSLRIRRWGTPSDVEATKLRFRKGDIIFGRRRAYQRKLAVADFNGICSAHAMVIRARPEAIVPEFLPFLMKSNIFMERARAISVGSLSPTINWKDLAREEFVIPPMEEQRRVTEALIAADTVRHSASEALSRLTEVRSALLRDFLSKHVERYGRANAADHLDRLTVGIVVKPADLYVQGNAGVPALRSLNVQPGRLLLNDLVRISLDGHRENGKSRLQAGDVVVVRTGRPGEAAVIPDNLGDLNCIDLIVATPSRTLRSSYLAAVLNSSIGRQQFLAGIAGTAQQHFNVGAFRKLQLPVPSLGEQDKLLRRLGELESARELLMFRQSSSESVVQSLLAVIGGR